MSPISEKGFGLIPIILLIALVFAGEIYLIVTNPQKTSDDSSKNRTFNLFLSPAPKPNSVTVSKKYINPIPNQPKNNPISNFNNSNTNQQGSNPQFIAESSKAQVISSETHTQTVSQINYVLIANLICKNTDDKIAGKHTDMEIGFQIQDPAAGYYYVMVTDNSSGQVVYGPFSSGDPVNSASFDIIYHGSISGFFTNTSDLNLNGGSGTLTVKLYKSMDPIINGAVIKEATVNKKCP